MFTLHVLSAHRSFTTAEECATAFAALTPEHQGVAWIDGEAFAQELHNIEEQAQADLDLVETVNTGHKAASIVALMAMAEMVP